MFSPDVVNFRQFYNSDLGRHVKKHIRHAIYSLWPELGNDTLIAIGYSALYIEPLIVSDDAEAFIVMPAAQGAAAWPKNKPTKLCLSNEFELPFNNNSVNKLLIIHSMEHSEQLSWLMDEVWRVLVPGGRVLAVVPNRNSLWSRSSRSPFGYGQPFSMSQMRELFVRHQFTPTRTGSALFLPPTHIEIIWKVARIFEKIGRRLFPFLGGVLLLEAEKQLYAAMKNVRSVHRSRAVGIPTPAINSKSYE